MSKYTRYYYQTSADGYCEYATKKAAVRNAIIAGALYVRASPSGRIVHVTRGGGEERGELCYSSGKPLEDIFQTPLD